MLKVDFFIFKSIEKSTFRHPVLTSRTWIFIFIHFMGYWEFFFKLAIFVQRGRRYKIGADGGHFSEVPRLREEILVF